MTGKSYYTFKKEAMDIIMKSSHLCQGCGLQADSISSLLAVGAQYTANADHEKLPE